MTRLSNGAYANSTFFLALRAAVSGVARAEDGTRLSILYSRVVARQGRATQGIETYPDDVAANQIEYFPDPSGNGAVHVYLPRRFGEGFTVSAGFGPLAALKAMAAQSLRFMLPGAGRWRVEWSDGSTRGAEHWLVQARIGDLPEPQQSWLGFSRATAKEGFIEVVRQDYLDVDILYVQSDVTVANKNVETNWGVSVTPFAE